MHAVTGAFGYIGRAITQLLLDRGEEVRTITTHPNKPNPFGPIVQAFPLDFSRPEKITAALEGVETFYNTYWIRFEFGGATFAQAVKNTEILFHCAQKAGVRKIVHISVTNAALDSPLLYYQGKAQQELALAACGVPYAVVRPTLVFGQGDILVNNIAWLMRKFPVFPIFGAGDYRLQPVYVGDLAELAVTSAGSAGTVTLDAAGPETYTFKEFATEMVEQIRPGLPLVRFPPGLGIALGNLIGWGKGDVLLTQAELQGLMDEMLTSQQAPTGGTRFSDWLRTNKNSIGLQYSSELARHFQWSVPSK